ncbi:hypothetical protein SmJEL517_g04283 [Synchytrium microbalum]|uniref:Inositol polyphosphate-related phosphatase domain-containing protein n=1 Tax=Synchytrium microbalum TaxID=1806994 RepID=A0A507BZU1_9FUNG|nr:uncharacterized protein SmJEL517_g04283 [Synchytrium microbalum]TPX32651.1 hypothetical protein SmJEL517_g04283 [Synchytrium microbalum]
MSSSGTTNPFLQPNISGSRSPNNPFLAHVESNPFEDPNSQLTPGGSTSTSSLPIGNPGANWQQFVAGSVGSPQEITYQRQPTFSSNVGSLLTSSLSQNNPPAVTPQSNRNNSDSPYYQSPRSSAGSAGAASPLDDMLLLKVTDSQIDVNKPDSLLDYKPALPARRPTIGAPALAPRPSESPRRDSLSAATRPSTPSRSVSPSVSSILSDQQAPPLPARPSIKQMAPPPSITTSNNPFINPFVSPSLDTSPERIARLKHQPIQIHTPQADSINRRPPELEQGPVEVQHKGSVRCFCISGTTLCTGTQNLRIFNVSTGENTRTNTLGDSKPICMSFLTSRQPSDEGRFVWVSVESPKATAEKGELFCVDVKTGETVERRVAHSATVTHILRSAKTHMWTIDDNGGLKIWGEDKSGPGGVISLLTSKPQSLRISSRQAVAHLAHGCLWTAQHRVIECYNPLSDAFQQRYDAGPSIGSVTALASTSLPQYVFSSHDDGKVLIWDNLERTGRLRIVNISLYRITALTGVGDRFLWLSLSTGKMQVYDFGDNATSSNWNHVKDWNGSHITELTVDEPCHLETGRLHVVSMSEHGVMKMWDGLLTRDFYDREMINREPQFCTYKDIKFFVGSFNLDAAKPDSLDEGRNQDTGFLSEWLSTVNNPDFIVIGLQEIIDLESTKANAKKFLQGSKTSNEKKNQDHRFMLWQKRLVTSVRECIPDRVYNLVQCNVLVGLFQAVFVADSEVSRLRRVDVEVQLVKTGLGGVYGNKGAIASRLIFDDSSFCFVNCHLAAHTANLAGRNADIANIIKDCNFMPRPFYDNTWVNGGDGSNLLDHDVVVWSGDLNFRLDTLGREQVLSLIERREWNLLQQHDQLIRQAHSTAFPLRMLKEGALDFPPTFKYDRNSTMYDSSDKKRVPAWCDRILYRGSTLSQTSYQRYECLVSDHRPIGSGFVTKVKKMNMPVRADVARQVRILVEENFNRILQTAREDWLTSITGNRALARKILMESKSLRQAREIAQTSLPQSS